MLFKFLIIFTGLVSAYVHPITVHGRYFVDSVTKEPFYIKGVDYQPGGSSGVVSHSDPLSNPKICARDVALFQRLGINTIRIYSVNPDLNHDICMSMLAAAGIYLVLDVNSPLPDHHLNRNEPWLSYNNKYLENVLRIVEQFSYYNNTLGFFAGNEVINDETSAMNSPVYVKAVIRDIKEYISHNSPRLIPVGYSAADDLKYRLSLSSYLECMEDTITETVDFYGVNSYQWCGQQTFHSSGYDVLVNDYSSFTRPVFFSEFGCNEVTPRVFDEIQVLYSKDMIDVFSGGLVYEFTQEPNNYGLVKVRENEDVELLADFLALQNQYHQVPPLDYSHIAEAMRRNSKQLQQAFKLHKQVIPVCETEYKNLDISRGLPLTVARELTEKGVNVKRGKFVPLRDEQKVSEFSIYQGGHLILKNPEIRVEVDYMSGKEVLKLKGYQNKASNRKESAITVSAVYNKVTNVISKIKESVLDMLSSH